MLGTLHWSICKWDAPSVFFNLRIVSKSPAEISTSIGDVLELRSCANLPGTTLNNILICCVRLKDVV